MAFNEITRFFPLSDFVSIVGPLTVEQFLTHVSDSSFSIPFSISLAGTGLRIDWNALPSLGDLATFDSKVASYEGAEVTSESTRLESLDEDTNDTSVPVNKLAYETPPLVGGTYLITFSSNLKLLSSVLGAWAKASMRVEKSDLIFKEEIDNTNQPHPFDHAFNGALVMDVLEGQTLEVVLSFSVIGLATAIMGAARVSIDKIG